ncbi:hypothetical protein SD70_21810 [Gordoniibacillus kamchatkensis]|uniref:Secreted protein n=1 Tax=Gordoniibacillus kamchatkensis TaxID=1590651 RepID=A0ABR5ADQ4_9BACL|nr:hypothetical protein SD70_21810 [Paenibacillus sp. VKM B-2647]
MVRAGLLMQVLFQRLRQTCSSRQHAAAVAFGALIAAFAAPTAVPVPLIRTNIRKRAILAPSH